MQVLGEAVLVLNRSFLPVEVTTVRRAFSLVIGEQAHVLNEDFALHNWRSWQDVPPRADAETIHTPSRVFRLPRVIVLIHYDRTARHEVKFNRKNIFLRDHNRYQYCGHHFPTRELSIDHVAPLSRGGKSVWENVVCACLRCNARKGNRPVAQSGLVLIRAPHKPRWHPLMKLGLARVRGFEPYKSLLDVAYWTVNLDDEGEPEGEERGE